MAIFIVKDLFLSKFSGLLFQLSKFSGVLFEIFGLLFKIFGILSEFLDAIASPSSYPCQSVSGPVIVSGVMLSHLRAFAQDNLTLIL